MRRARERVVTASQARKAAPVPSRQELLAALRHRKSVIEVEFLQFGADLERFRDLFGAKELVSACRNIGLSVRTAYLLMRASKTVAVCGIDQSRATAVGYTKISAVADVITPANKDFWLKRCAAFTVQELQSLARSPTRKEHAKTFTMTLAPQTRRRFLALLKRIGEEAGLPADATRDALVGALCDRGVSPPPRVTRRRSTHQVIEGVAWPA